MDKWVYRHTSRLQLKKQTYFTGN